MTENSLQVELQNVGEDAAQLEFDFVCPTVVADESEPKVLFKHCFWEKKLSESTANTILIEIDNHLFLFSCNEMAAEYALSRLQPAMHLFER